MEELYESVRNIREVVAQLVSWASAAGLGYDAGEELLNKLYSSSIVCNNYDEEDE